MLLVANMIDKYISHKGEAFMCDLDEFPGMRAINFLDEDEAYVEYTDERPSGAYRGDIDEMRDRLVSIWQDKKNAMDKAKAEANAVIEENIAKAKEASERLAEAIERRKFEGLPADKVVVINRMDESEFVKLEAAFEKNRKLKFMWDHIQGPFYPQQTYLDLFTPIFGEKRTKELFDNYMPPVL